MKIARVKCFKKLLSLFHEHGFVWMLSHPAVQDDWKEGRYTDNTEAQADNEKDHHGDRRPHLLPNEQHS